MVFCGGRIPFVLRPMEFEVIVATRGRRRKRGLFSFVGEAYCDGVMDGEAVEGGKLREFYLV